MDATDIRIEAAILAQNLQQIMKSPAAMLLPAPAREAVRDLARLVHHLAITVEKIECSNPGNPSK